jgi:hypothetical protein
LEKKMSKHTVRYRAQIDMFVMVDAEDEIEADEIAHPKIVEYIDTVLGNRSLGVSAMVDVDSIDNYAVEETF